MIDPKLQTLLMVIEKGSYSDAADALSLTQPAVSQHIHQLEKELDIKIFHRSSRKINLTKEGEIAVKFAKRVSSLYRELERKIKDEALGRHSYVIGITHTAEASVIADVLALYAVSHQGVKIKIKSDSIKNLYEKLSTYEIDLAIVDGKPLKKYSSILLDTDSLMVVMGKHHPLAKKQIVTLEDLKKERLVLRSKSSETRAIFDRVLSSFNYSLDEFDVLLEIDNIMTIKELVSKEEVVSILPRSACHSYGDKDMLSLRPIENCDMMREINLVFPKDFSHRAFLDELLHLYRKHIFG